MQNLYASKPVSPPPVVAQQPAATVRVRQRRRYSGIRRGVAEMSLRRMNRKRRLEAVRGTLHLIVVLELCGIL